jgi:hypothetical protein
MSHLEIALHKAIYEDATHADDTRIFLFHFLEIG